MDFLEFRGFQTSPINTALAGLKIHHKTAKTTGSKNANVIVVCAFYAGLSSVGEIKLIRSDIYTRCITKKP